VSGGTWLALLLLMGSIIGGAALAQVDTVAAVGLIVAGGISGVVILWNELS